MKFPTIICYLCLLVLCSAILSSGRVVSYGSRNRLGGIPDVFRGYNNPISYAQTPLFDLHCYDVTGITTVHDGCWNNPRTTDIVIRNRDVSSRINGRRFSVYDSLGGGDLIAAYPDVYESDLLTYPTGLGFNCFDPRGIRIVSDDCWTSPKINQLQLISRSEDSRVNTRRFGVSSTYYGANSLVSVIDEIEDCYCVTQDRVSDVLFVKLYPSYSLTPTLKSRLLGMNWNDLDGCVPVDVIQVPYLPYRTADFGNSLFY